MQMSGGNTIGHVFLQVFFVRGVGGGQVFDPVSRQLSKSLAVIQLRPFEKRSYRFYHLLLTRQGKVEVVRVLQERRLDPVRCCQGLVHCPEQQVAQPEAVTIDGLPVHVFRVKKIIEIFFYQQEVISIDKFVLAMHEYFPRFRDLMALDWNSTVHRD